MDRSLSRIDDPAGVRRLDTLGMADLLRSFPAQVREALQIGEDFKPSASLGRGIEKVVFVGMGGSAIGGDVIRSLLYQEARVPIFVVRHYELPPFVDSRALCIFSSYSGNTEETISAFRQGMKRRVKGVLVTSGGELSRLSRRFSIPWIQIPAGFPPRAALGYSVFPLLRFLTRLGFGKWDARGVEETVSLMEGLAEREFSPEVPAKRNPAKKLASKLRGKIVAIYAGAGLLECAALRFRNQIEENAKALASHHVLPEMNHNEILGWQFPESALSRCAAVFLRDSGDHPRIRLRFRITEEVVGRSKAPIFEIPSQGKSLLARLFSTIYEGDWVSFYLALLYGVDPTPVKGIEFLKEQLAKVPG